MGARTKLNQGYTITSIIFAVFIAGLLNSSLVFFIALGILLASNYQSGNIREKGHWRRKNQRNAHQNHRERKR